MQCRKQLEPKSSVARCASESRKVVFLFCGSVGCFACAALKLSIAAVSAGASGSPPRNPMDGLACKSASAMSTHRYSRRPMVRSRNSWFPYSATSAYASGFPTTAGAVRGAIRR